MKKTMDQQSIFTKELSVVKRTKVLSKYGMTIEGCGKLGLNNPEKITVKV